MALANKLKKSKKKKKDEDEDETPTPKKKKGTKAAAEADDDDDDEEEEEEEEETEDDDAEGEEEEEEESDNEESDDEEEEESDDDSEEDEEEEDEDEDEAPAKSKKKSKSSASSGKISWDTDDAEEGGLPEGRFVLLNPKARFGSLAQYNDDDEESGAPMLSITCVPVNKKGKVTGDPMMIHLTAGKRERIVPTDDHTDFQPATGKEGKVKGLSKSSNVYYFIKSAEDAGLTKEKLRAKGMAIFDGMEVEIARVPQPERPGLSAKAEGEGDSFAKTMPSIETIHSFPWEKKGAAAREAAMAKAKKKGGKKRPKAEAAEDQDEEETDLDTKYPRVDKKTKATKVKKSSDSDLIEAAEAAILKAASLDKYSKKGLKKDDIYPASFQFVSKHPERKSIMALIESDDFYADDARPWNWDDNLERITLV